MKLRKAFNIISLVIILFAVLRLNQKGYSDLVGYLVLFILIIIFIKLIYLENLIRDLKKPFSKHNK